MVGGELGIFPSSKTSLEGAKTRAYIGGRGVQKASLEMESLKLFQVPEPLQWGRARNFSESQSLFGRGG